MTAIAPGPGFRLSRGRALRRAYLRRRARYQKQGPGATAVKKPLFYQSSMHSIKPPFDAEAAKKFLNGK